MNSVFFAILMSSLLLNLIAIFLVIKKNRADCNCTPGTEGCHWVVSIIEREISLPLSTLNSYLDMAGESSGLPFAVSRNIELAQATTNQIEHFIEELSAYKLYSSTEFSPDLEPVNFSALLSTVTSEYREKIRKKGLVLQTNIDRSVIATFHTDYTLIRQIATSLLSNSVQYTMRGTVKLSAAYDGTVCTLTIADTGVGMESTQVETLFHSDQIDPHLLEGNGGLGILLVRKAVKLLGGTITCKSSLNKGTAIDVVIPLKPLTVQATVAETALREFEEHDPATVEALDTIPLVPDDYLDALLEDSDIATLLDDLYVALLIGDSKRSHAILSRLVKLTGSFAELEPVHSYLHDFDFTHARDQVTEIAEKRSVVLMGGRYV